MLYASVALMLALLPGCELITGPEKDIAATLKAREGVTSFELPGVGTVQTDRLVFDRLLVKPENDAFTAVATVDLDGRVGEQRVSYIGFERIPFERRDGRQQPKGSLAPNLADILSALRARASAFSRGDAQAYAELLAEGWEEESISREALIARLERDFARGPRATLRPTAWVIRNEREGATVTEEFEVVLEGQPPHQARGRYLLKREGGRFRFASGLR
ncbi:MAG: nuclear transport factor 2 family protein [Myxococcales bacterium]